MQLHQCQSGGQLPALRHLDAIHEKDLVEHSVGYVHVAPASMFDSLSNLGWHRGRRQQQHARDSSRQGLWQLGVVRRRLASIVIYQPPTIDVRAGRANGRTR